MEPDRRNASADTTPALCDLPDLHDRIVREGPVPFADYMEAALYGEHGFYTVGGGAGRRRDFVTSPETGALFAAVVARAFDSWWRELGCPDPFVVIEPGAGPGTLATGVVLANPDCVAALRWVLVDRSPSMRELHRLRSKTLPLVEPSQLFGGLDRERDDMIDDGPDIAPQQGPLVTSLAEFPSGVAAHLIVCNELLDNLCFNIGHFDGERWCDVRIALDEHGRYVEMLVPADERTAQHCTTLVAEPKPGTRIPLLREATQWLVDALSTLDHGGRMVAFDYGASTTAELAERGSEWLRLYRNHRRVQSATEYPGLCDITTDVPVDQLAAVARPTTVQSQASFLKAHGIDHIAAEAHRVLADAAPGTLNAARLASFSTERRQLCDATGLGRFLVMEWVR